MNAKERKKLARAVAHRSELNKDSRLEKRVALSLLCCSARVYKATILLPLRNTEHLEQITFKQHNKVINPLGQQINARQKMRGKSIPLI